MIFRWALILSLALLSGCTNSANKLANRPVVDVSGKKLTAKDFSDQLARSLKSFDALGAKDPNNVRRAKEEIIRNFIMQSLAENYAKANSIVVTDEELESEVNAFRASYPDDISFRKTLAESSMSLSEWKTGLRKSLLEKKVFTKISANLTPPTADEISKYYVDNKDLFKRKERIYLRQIILDELSKAEAVKAELNRRKDFVELAKKFSVAPEAKSGGLVGWIEKGSVDIFDKAFSLPIGGTSQVLESSYGFHIFRVERRAAPGYASLDEVRDQIRRTLMAKKEQGEFAAWLDKQIRDSRVLRDNALMDAIVVETRTE